jgi:hypothetical protein
LFSYVCFLSCDREFHLDCCEPSLQEVPVDSYYCCDCSPKGMTVSLEDYFEKHHEERANFESSRDFVTKRLTDMLDTIDYIPQSELARATKLHHDALSFSSRFIQIKNLSPHAAKVTKSRKVEAVKPEFFLGKCIRLYCPLDNQYHTGRIIDWRKASFSSTFWDSEVADIEYCVRFLAGIDYRKKPCQQWLVLEEHSLAIAATLIWGMSMQRKGVLGFNPGQTWLRTSLELVPIQSCLDKQKRQIYSMGDAVKPEHKSWALVHFPVDELHLLLELKDESVDFFSVAFGEARHQRNLVTNDLDAGVEVSIGLIQVEWEEQQRVRAWQQMKLVNEFHPKALTLRDEATLAPCFQRECDPRLCPSIQIDFDRTYLMESMVKAPTRDMAGSLVCELVAASPRTMQLLQQQRD